MKFAQISRGISYVVLPILYVLVAGIRLRSSLDVPLATAPASGKSNSASSSLSSLSKDTTKFPLVIFSHGLSGTRTTYSAYCSNLASHGQIVVGIEHRDGSSPFSAVTLPNGEERLVDYLRMPALRFEGPILSENEFREDQLKMRVSEVAAAFKLMESLDSGERVKNLRSSKADLGMWQDRIDFSSLVISLFSINYLELTHI